jgi:lysophospholipase L1-like esterase
MQRNRLSLLLIALVSFAFLFAALGPAFAQPAATLEAPVKAKTTTEKQPEAVTPVPRNTDSWQKRQKTINDRIAAKKGNVDLIFIGDSITQGWEGRGKEVWKKYYEKRNAANLGISGDQTQHVLWRLDNGNVEGISPKLAVIMIGTNNSNGRQKPEDIAAGVKMIVEKLRDKLPQTKILLLGIFPRGADDQDPRRQINMKVNEIISKLADSNMIFYLDIGDKFLDSDHKLSKDIMPDLLHPDAKGYEIWAEAIEPEVAKLMGEK